MPIRLVQARQGVVVVEARICRHHAYLVKVAHEMRPSHTSNVIKDHCQTEVARCNGGVGRELVASCEAEAMQYNTRAQIASVHVVDVDKANAGSVMAMVVVMYDLRKRNVDVVRR
jgi:hypothetical protein